MPKQVLNLRLSEEGIARVDAFAEAERCSRADMIRRLLSEATQARDLKAAREQGRKPTTRKQPE